MRPTMVVLGLVALAVGLVVALATGQPALAGWMLIGPGPYLLAGIAVTIRRPDRTAGFWCLVAGAMFVVSVCLGDVLLPLLTGWPGAWLLALPRLWAEYLVAVAVIALVGWFPGGRPQRPAERWLLWAATGTAVAVPVLYALTHPLMAPGGYPNPEAPRVPSPLHVAALDFAAPVTEALHSTVLAWSLIGFGLLASRYRRTSLDERRRIRLLLLGFSVAILLIGRCWWPVRCWTTPPNGWSPSCCGRSCWRPLSVRW